METQTGTAERKITCYCMVTNQRTFRQESYETASGDARVRARALRKAGYTVYVEGMGEQVTSVGRVKMTLVTIVNPDDNVPTVNTERL